MTNLEKFNQAFVEVFGVDESALTADFSKENVDSWDSVHQLNIIAILEETFDIMMDPEDITRNIGIRIVTAMASDVTYQSVLGLNVLIINI